MNRKRQRQRETVCCFGGVRGGGWLCGGPVEEGGEKTRGSVEEKRSFFEISNLMTLQF